LIRPKDNMFIVQYSDSAGRQNNLVVDSTGNSTIATLLADAQQRVPAEKDNPVKSEVEQEIAELEYRLTQLKQSIGVA
jgi:uncharacterized protein YceH (UPF0502 family)